MNKTKLPSMHDMINGNISTHEALHGKQEPITPVEMEGKKYYYFPIHPEWLKIYHLYAGMRQVKMRKKMLDALTRR